MEDKYIGKEVNGCKCLERTDKKSGSHYKYLWECSEEGCENTFERTVDHIKRGQIKCEECSGKIKDYTGKIVNRCKCLEKTNKKYRNAAIYLWECSEEGCKNTFEGLVANVKKGGNKCNECSKIRIDYTGKIINGCKCLGRTDITKGHAVKYLWECSEEGG